MTVKRKKQHRALSLFSGGLDSQLAICVLREQGIHVEAVIFRSPFFSSAKGEREAKKIGVKYHLVDFTDDILELVQNPPHGFGKAMNPCIDCHITMVQRTGKLLEEWGFDFIATGEVLGQRPMSQNRQSLDVVARCSQYGDLLLRPLCAAFLSPVRPIREGWVDVGKLPALRGRNRVPQIELAKKFGLTDYPTPAGGCLLTEKYFGLKLKDLLDHEGIDDDRTNIRLLSIGRHFRLSDNVKIIVGQNKQQNELLNEKAHKEDYRLTCIGAPGPLVIVSANATDEEIRTAAAICARYSDTPADKPVTTRIIRGNQVFHLSVVPMPPEEIDRYRITG